MNLTYIKKEKCETYGKQKFKPIYNFEEEEVTHSNLLNHRFNEK